MIFSNPSESAFIEETTAENAESSVLFHGRVYGSVRIPSDILILE